MAERIERVDAVIVGAGFAGLYMAHRLHQAGLTVRGFEAGGGVGGTWYWNRYPGARCDVESMEYSYQFDADLQQEWEWTERYAGQPEILRYANHVADRFDLRRHFAFNTRVTAAAFAENANAWRIETDAGNRVVARFCIMATGCLSSTNTPAIKGLDSFRGNVHHTGKWPHKGVDFRGQRVGIIGTGSSAIQAIPVIANEARHLTVFQRTPNYSIPARNGPLCPETQRNVKAEYPAFRARNSKMPGALGADMPMRPGGALEDDAEARQRQYEAGWERGGFAFLIGYNDLLINPESNETAAQFVRDRIAEIVEDPSTAALLAPHNVIGCKRPCLDTGYYETFNRDNATLVDVSETPIDEITPEGVVVDGQTHALDCLVLATGFDAMTGTLNRIDIRGRGGQALKDKWSAGPVTYLGLAVAGFPNLFMISGPGSPSVLTNMLVSIEQHVDWIARCIGYLREHRLAAIEATQRAEDEWVAHVNAVAGETLYPTCNSWYLGANVPGKPRVFMPYVGFPPYVERCDEVAAGGYEGFALSN